MFLPVHSKHKVLGLDLAPPPLYLEGGGIPEKTAPPPGPEFMFFGGGCN